MMNNARNASALQGGGTLPAWNSGDYLGYDGGGRMITKRYVSSALNESGGYVTPVTAIVGWTTAYDLASNKLFERALHAESRSALYEPYVLSAPQGGYDSVNRLRQYQRGDVERRWRRDHRADRRGQLPTSIRRMCWTVWGIGRRRRIRRKAAR